MTESNINMPTRVAGGQAGARLVYSSAHGGIYVAAMDTPAITTANDCIVPDSEDDVEAKIKRD